MKITAPLNPRDDMNKLVASGADEFYLGVLTKDWLKKYGVNASPNRRYFEESNFRTFRQVKKFLGYVDNKKIFLALNAPYYSKEQYKDILKVVDKSIGLGIDDFIIADMGLLLELNKLDVNIAISTVNPAFNSETVKLYKELGAKRVILPRQLRIDEIKKITKVKDIEFESFVMHDYCKNIDGFCTSHHGIENSSGLKHLCTQLNIYRGKEKLLNYRMKNLCFGDFCSACNLKELKKAGVDFVKIAGRRFDTEKKVNSIKFVKEALKLKKKAEIAALHTEYFGTKCPDNCNPNGI